MNAQKEEENLLKRKQFIMQKLTGSSSQVENASGDVEVLNIVLFRCVSHIQSMTINLQRNSITSYRILRTI
jgi:hypothetical protein